MRIGPLAQRERVLRISRSRVLVCVVTVEGRCVGAVLPVRIIVGIVVIDADDDARRHPAEAMVDAQPGRCRPRSEEHTSELQSLMRIAYAVFCLKKKHTKE